MKRSSSSSPSSLHHPSLCVHHLHRWQNLVLLIPARRKVLLLSLAPPPFPLGQSEVEKKKAAVPLLSILSPAPHRTQSLGGGGVIMLSSCGFSFLLLNSHFSPLTIKFPGPLLPLLREREKGGRNRDRERDRERERESARMEN